MKTACFDIETVPNSEAENWVNSQLPKAPANYKDPLKIAAKELENREKLRDKLALHWWTGRVVLICASVDGLNHSFISRDEVQILHWFADFLKDHQISTLMGKSSDDFDVPFLVGRYIANDIGIPSVLQPYNNRVVQDIDQWFGHRSSQQSTLENYAWGMGIRGKTASYKKVAEWWDGYLDGNKESMPQLIAYCAQDVAIVSEFLKRTRTWNAPSWKEENLNVPF
jgi:hypothetical protein